MYFAWVGVRRRTAQLKWTKCGSTGACSGCIPISLGRLFALRVLQGLQAVTTEGVINLLWDANTEADLDGYILLRGLAPDGELASITPSPIRETAFQDRVPAGVRYVYALRAVDKAGNASQPSERLEEAAR